MKSILALGVLLVLILVAFWFFEAKAPTTPAPTNGNSSVSDYTYTNASVDKIVVENPTPNANVSHTFTVSGKARGNWYFEASFPITITNTSGAVLFQEPVQAGGEWMTEDFVPFSISVTIPASHTGVAQVTLHNDNPSGDPARDASVSFPVVVE